MSSAVRFLGEYFHPGVWHRHMALLLRLLLPLYIFGLLPIFASSSDGRCCEKRFGCGPDAVCMDPANKTWCTNSLEHCVFRCNHKWCPSGPPGPGNNTGELQLTLLENTHCLDGSPAGYYYRAATTSPNLFVIFLQGGGACDDETKCKQRSHSALGTSTKWLKTNNGQKSPFLQTSEVINPDFYGAHHVYVAYCSGDAHKGTQTSATSTTYGFWFSGSVNFKSIVEDLKAKRGLGDATHVLLTGTSAGAEGTFHQVDRLQSYLAPGVVVKAAPVSGWFMPAETGDFDGKGPLPTKKSFAPPANYSAFKSGVVPEPSNASFQAMAKHEIQLKGDGYVLPACAADHPDDIFVCLTADTFYHYVKAPVFVIENRFDKYALEQEEGFPDDHSGPEPQAYLRYYGRATVVSVSQVGKGSHAGDGLFLASCLDHTGNYMANTKATINGTTFVAPVGDWFFERNKMSHLLMDDCGDLPCNPTCDH